MNDKEDKKEFKTETFKFRLTLSEACAIDEIVYQLNLSRSEYLRRIVLEKRPIFFDFSALDQVSYEIGRIGANINQIAKKLNQGGKLQREDAEFLQTSMLLLHQSVQQIYDDVMKRKEDVLGHHKDLEREV